MLNLFLTLFLMLAPTAKFGVTVKPYGNLRAHRDAIVATVTVPQDPRNRLLTIQLISENYATTSDRGLDGAAAPVRHYVTFRDIPEGEYKLIAWVTFLDGGRYKEVSTMFPGALEFR